ncbi:MAG: hypothetical protein K0S01_317 [Herbinix sp.]|jgi:hypothetical protein|nr:hypothetical protein [Herbinix sp.]
MINEDIAKNETSFQTIIAIELKTYTKTTMFDNSEFLLAKGRKMNEKNL